jgi:hypothetical protein
MKNIAKLAISGFFYVSVVAAMFGSWFVLWEVFGFTMLGFWLLACVSAGVERFVNPFHSWFSTVKAINAGLNIGLFIVYVIALFTVLGWWAAVIAAAFTMVAFAYHYATARSPFEAEWGATSVWAK